MTADAWHVAFQELTARATMRLMTGVDSIRQSLAATDEVLFGFVFG